MNFEDEQRIIEIDIFGTSYKFKADENVKEPKKVQELISNEVKKIREGIKGGSANSLPLMIMAGLNISKKLFEIKKSKLHLTEKSIKKLDELNAILENAVYDLGERVSEPLIRTNNNIIIEKNQPEAQDQIKDEEPEIHEVKKELKPEKKIIPEIIVTEVKKQETPISEPKQPAIFKNKDSIQIKMPEIDFLEKNSIENLEVDTEYLKSQALKLEKKLLDFSIKGEVKEIAPGPVITTFEYKPAPGIKISKIVNLENDIALALSALSVRIVAPIPGKNVIGIEVPNKKREIVRLREIIESNEFDDFQKGLPLCLGKDIDGNPFVSDLTKMPHLLIAGATGTGKSVCLNAMITSLLYKCSPDDVKLLMVDPKRIELSLYNDIPHLITPVVTDMKKATHALNWAVSEMEQRYDLLADKKVRNINQYNRKAKEEGFEELPYLVIIIDELADLMMVASRDVETALARLAQMARAAGIHLILATQRPSVDVLTGVIKANFPTRISFQVSSKIDSRTILDTNGAETLLGNGDMIFLPPGISKLKRLHGAYVSELEVNKVIDYLKSQKEPEYIEDITSQTLMDENSGAQDDYDPLYDKAVNFITTTKQASISSLQRHMRIGFNRAARIIETMERDGILGPANGSKPREILVGNFENI